MTTYTDKTPIRLDASHYQIESARRGKEGHHYNMIFSQSKKRWVCDCPDADPGQHNILHADGSPMAGNPNCKHVRRLREYIAEQEAATKERQEQAIADMAAHIGSLREALDQMGQQLSEASDRIIYLELEVQRAAKRQQAQARELKEQMAREVREFLQAERQQSESQQAQLDDLRADLQEEREANTQRFSQAHQEKCIQDLIELSRLQAAEIEELKHGRKIELAISVQVPTAPPHPTPRTARKAKTSQLTEPKQITNNLYSVDGNNVIVEPAIPEANKPGKAISCDCDNRKPCQHMKAVNKILK